MPAERVLRRVGASVVALAALAGCTGDDSASRSTSSATPTSAVSSVPVASSPDASPATTAPIDPAGPGESGVASSAPTTAEAVAIDTVPGDDSVLAVLRSRPDLSRFTELVEALGSDAVFQQARGVTVLAPNDAAFSEFGDAEWATLVGDRDAVALVLSEHLAIGARSLGELIEAGTFPSAMARQLPVASAGSVTIGPATVIEADLSAVNGYVHVVDSVIEPPTP